MKINHDRALQKNGSNSCIVKGSNSTSQCQIIVLTICLLTLLVSPQRIFASTDTLDIAVSIFPPLVIEEEGDLTGFDIDLWNRISHELGYVNQYYIVPFDSLLYHVNTNLADAALGGITITSDREEIVDFSHHYFDSGLLIMTNSETMSSLKSNMQILFSPAVLRGISYLALFLILCGHIMWWSEHGKDAINDKYFPGIFEAYWLVLTTMTTVGYGDIAPRKWLGRIAAFVVMMTGIALFGWIISEFSSAATLNKIRSNISSPSDLADRTAATVKGTTSIDILNGVGAEVVEKTNFEECCIELSTGRVDAVVFDAPVIMDFMKNSNDTRVAGNLFAVQYYGIAFPTGSDKREEVNRVILRLQEESRDYTGYSEIYRKWFGETSNF